MAVLGGAAMVGGAKARPHEPNRPHSRKKALVIGHRGASALRPEHTIASYIQAIADGADAIEPDLVMTRDGVLVARHENNIAETTNVSERPEFASRRTEKFVDGQRQIGWFTEDFTLAELKTLRAKERLPTLRPANAAMDGWFDIPTWEEVVDLAAAASVGRTQPIGLVPELKHSTYFANLDLSMEERFLDTLTAHHQTRFGPVTIQSFEAANLRYLRKKLDGLGSSNIRLLQLASNDDEIPADVQHAGGTLTYRQMLTADGLRQVALYADIIAPDKQALMAVNANGRWDPPSPVIGDAHQAGLDVWCWTFRSENQFLPPILWQCADPATRNPYGAVAEIRRYLDLGIDGFFTDDPALGVNAVSAPLT